MKIIFKHGEKSFKKILKIEEIVVLKKSAKMSPKIVRKFYQSSNE